MTEDRIDALLGKLDIVSRPDESFVTASTAMLLVRARAARVQDRSRLGRVQRDLSVVMEQRVWPTLPRWMVVAGAVGLLILATAVATLLVAGALDRRPKVLNGPLIVSIGGQIRAIDPDSGASRIIPVAGAPRVTSVALPTDA